MLIKARQWVSCCTERVDLQRDISCFTRQMTGRGPSACPPRRLPSQAMCAFQKGRQRAGFRQGVYCCTAQRVSESETHTERERETETGREKQGGRERKRKMERGRERERTAVHARAGHGSRWQRSAGRDCQSRGVKSPVMEVLAACEDMLLNQPATTLVERWHPFEGALSAEATTLHATPRTTTSGCIA